MNLSQRETLVMRLLENAAERGDQCPGNAFIAGAIGAGSISAPPEVIKGLEKKGYISVQRFQRSRVVTICATGKQTAAVAMRCIGASVRRQTFAVINSQRWSQKACRLIRCAGHWAFPKLALAKCGARFAPGWGSRQHELFNCK